MQNEKKKRKAKLALFTLMEMVIVIAILALLGGIATPMLLNNLKKAKVQTAKTQIQVIDQAVLQFQIDTGKLPRSLDELVKDTGDKKWKGPYLDKVTEIPKDPWGNEYNYVVPGSHGEFDIVSYGEDGSSGGEKFKADLGNWIEPEN